MVSSLITAISTGDTSLGTVSFILTRILREDVWLHFRTRFGEDVTYAKSPVGFERFVREPPMRGLGTDPLTLRQLIDHDIQALAAFEKFTKRPAGINQYTEVLYNVQDLKAPTGNSEMRALRMLREKRPDLHTKVLARELSPHAAMLEAGFRRRTMTITLDSPKSAETLVKNASPEFLAELRRLLNE